MNSVLQRFFARPGHSTPESIALLIMRLVAGTAFVAHGSQKIQNAGAWMGPDSPVPGIFQFLAAISEFGGGIAWMAGLLTPLASLGIACTMSVAVFMHMLILKDPFVNLTGGHSYELASAYLCIALVLLILGPGKFSLDNTIFRKRS